MSRKLRRRPRGDPLVAGMTPYERAYVVRSRDPDGTHGCAIVAATSSRAAVARLRRMEPDRVGERLTTVLARNAQPAELEEARDAEASWTTSRECAGCGAVIWTVSGEMHEELCGECRRGEGEDETCADRG